MSKKILKRSLALGALMAFVITGSALAGANLTISGDDDYNNFTGNDEWACTYIMYSKISSSDNTLTISNVSNMNKGNIYVAYVTSGDATVAYNTLNINGGVNTSKRLEAAYVNVSSANKSTVSNNSVVVNGSAVLEGNVIAGHVNHSNNSGGANIDVENNTVTVKGGARVKNVYGAYVFGSSLKTNFEGKNNVVVIDGETTIVNGDVYGAYADIRSEGIGSKFGTAILEGNSVNVTGGTVEGNVYGGYAIVKSYDSSVILNSQANNNIVNLSGGTVNGNVYGGYSEEVSAEVIGTDEVIDSSASNNTISLQGDVDVSNAKLYGSNGGEGSGNKLEFDESYTGGDGGKAIDTVGNFDTIKIESADADNPIKIENLNFKEADATTGEGGTAVVVDKLQMESGTKEGESVKLFETTNSTGDIDEDNSKATVYVGTAEMGTASIGGDLQNNGINLTVQELDMNPQVLVIGESRVAATAFVNQGSELVETGLDALARDNAKAGDTKVFAAVYGNASEYATGSHVKVNGWSGIVGVGKTNDNGLTIGAFFENGDGNYRTYNVNAGTFMRGDGEAVYNGGGLLVRKDNANGVYTEASLRAGNLKNELKNAVMGKAGLDGYDVDTFYYGAHVGIGKVIPRGNEGDSIDVYGKFMYTHHDGETFNIQGDAYKFDSVDSERLRLGFRINEVQTNKLSMYYGAAWEYEFGGDADNKVIGYDLSTPSLGGSTMIGEVGMHYLASEKWSLDLNVRGYSGQRDGFTGSVQANYSF